MTTASQVPTQPPARARDHDGARQPQLPRASPPAPRGGVRRRRRRTPRWWQALAIVLALAMLYLGVTAGQVWQASRQDHAQPSEAIIVLGAAQYNGRPSPPLQARLDHALALYRKGVARMIVVTGGRRAGDRFTEATTGYNFLRRRGVPDRSILKEVQGRTTWESLSAVARILRRRHMREVVVVSNPYHAKRLGEVARELGLRPHVSPAGRPAGLGSLVRETSAVAVGRIIGYRRLERFDR